MGNLLGKCASKTKTFFDQNGDGLINAEEVIVTISESLKILKSATSQIKDYVQMAEDLGLDTKGTLEVLTQLNKILDGSTKVSNQLAQIRIPSSLQEIGDVNRDGVINKHDAIAYLQGADELCSSLIAAGVQVKEVNVCRQHIKNLLDRIDTFPAELRSNSSLNH